jgi:hypothetical protein
MTSSLGRTPTALKTPVYIPKYRKNRSPLQQFRPGFCPTERPGASGPARRLLRKTRTESSRLNQVRIAEHPAPCGILRLGRWMRFRSQAALRKVQCEVTHLLFLDGLIAWKSRFRWFR